jgi:hypothetical protein
MMIRRYAALFVLSALLSGCNVEADFSGDIPTETLPAESYRSEIVTIDRLIFTEAPLGASGADELRKSFEGLSARVAAETHTKFGKVESLELKLLASRAGRLSPSGNAGVMQNDWMRIRSNMFDDRAWFARSARDLEYAANEMRNAKAAGTVAGSTQAIATGPPVTEESHEVASPLRGRWRVVNVFVNGRASGDPELFGSIWTFAPPRLTMQTRESGTETYNYLPEGRYIRATNSAGVDGWMLYGQAGDTLFVAFYDGLKGKPESFDAVEGQKDPALVKLVLTRAK